MSDQLVSFSGITPSGGFLIDPVALEEVAEVALSRGESQPTWWRNLFRQAAALFKQTFFGWSVDLNCIDEAHWGVVFPEDISSEVRDAVEPLIEIRASQQAGRRFILFYRPGESVERWAKRYGVDNLLDPDPEKIPYYLLVAGSPQQIPFRFQQDLVTYATGRLCFENVIEYQNYIRNLVVYIRELEIQQAILETGRTGLLCVAPCRFNQENDFTHLGLEMTGRVREKWIGDKQFPEFAPPLLGNHATRSALLQVLTTLSPEVILFVGHGLHVPPGSEMSQADWEGALVCQEEDGLSWFSSADVTPKMQIHNSIWVALACHGAGTPAKSDYSSWFSEREMAHQDQVSSLPQRILGDNRPGLAFIGHVDSVTGLTASSDLFSKLLVEIYTGRRLGQAMRHFRERSVVSGDFILRWQDAFENSGMRPPQRESFAAQWIAWRDARNFLLLGDPAIQICQSSSALSS